MISLFQVIKGRTDIAWACTPTRTKTGIDFYGYNYGVNESIPYYITVINLTNPNTHTDDLRDTSATQCRHRVSAVDGDVVMILTPSERYVLYIYNGEVITLLSGNLKDTPWPSQEEIEQQISLVPEAFGRLKVEMYMNELFAKWPNLPDYFNDIISIVYMRMKRDNLEYTPSNVKDTLSVCTREAFASLLM